MYPRVLINKTKFRHNLKYMLDQCHERNVSVMAVSKVFCADPELVSIMIDEGVDYIGDSRIENLASFATHIPKVLLRLPMYSEAEKVVRHSDISLNSEYATIHELDHQARHLNVKHGIIIMIDLGDLREGVFEEAEVFDLMNRVLKLDNIVVKGIGTNLTCYGGVIPTKETLQKLLDYKTKLENEFNFELDIISGGNSSTVDMLFKGELPEGINNLRLGESIVLSRETAYGMFLDSMYNDIFTLEAEIIELKEKPSIPIGEIGMNAFGKVPIFKDKGIMHRAILAIGQQDVDYKELIPYDTVECIGSSSDHIIVDVSDSYNVYHLGDTILFRLTYASVLSTMTSKYVKKVYVE